MLGICNGFQILTESHLLPGSMIKNDHLKFVCRDQVLSVENSDTAWTRDYAAGQEITDPAEEPGRPVRRGREDAGRARGRGPRGVPLRGLQPERSRRDIAGISNAAGNVVGLMPHPEHAVEAGFGPDGAEGPRTRHRRAAVLHVGPARARRLTPRVGAAAEKAVVLVAVALGRPGRRPAADHPAGRAARRGTARTTSVHA